MKFNPSLYLVTDPDLTAGRTVIDIVKAALTGGVTAVQLREKTASTREFIEKADAIIKVVHDRGVPLIINDRVDVALAVGADGVHLGSSDMPYDDVRGILGPESVIGLSVETVGEAEAMSGLGANYFGVSPIFATETKPDHSLPLGLSGLRKIREKVSEPLVAIGGVNTANVTEVIAAGADGVAVVTAITLADDPAEAANNLLAKIQSAKKQYAGH